MDLNPLIQLLSTGGDAATILVAFFLYTHHKRIEKTEHNVRRIIGYLRRSTDNKQHPI